MSQSIIRSHSLKTENTELYKSIINIHESHKTSPYIFMDSFSEMNKFKANNALIYNLLIFSVP